MKIMRNTKLKKEITFVYMDSAEKSIYKPLAEEAEKRGYKIKFTENIFEKSEIGFYCQHVNFPQYSKFSVIMLHDIIQQHGNWPDIWLREPWNKYNIGILPSDQWVENWNECSHNFYTRPKNGMYKVGWPKADNSFRMKSEEQRKQFYKEYGLDLNKKTILYAPSWENDGKQDDFVQAMLLLDVNILIKHSDVSPEKFPEMYKAVNEMKKLHENIERVKILPAKMNIFDAIAMSDVLVSEESSTMCEAIMMGVPAVAVNNWLIPDVTPSRYPKCDYDFVITTSKENLKNCIENIISDYETYKKKAVEFGKNNFSNIGNSSKMIMDIVDDCVEGHEIRYNALKPQTKRRMSIKEYIYFKYLCMRRELYDNYAKKNKMVKALWMLARRLKRLIKK